MIASLAMLVAVLVPIPTIIKSMKERVTPFRAVINGVLSGTLGALIVMVIGQLMGVNAFDELFKAVDSMVKVMSENAEFAALFGEDVSKDQLTEMLTVIYENSIKLLPGCIVIISLFASYVEYIILSRILKFDGLTPIPMTKMQEFDLPRRLVTLWCLVYIAMLILSKTDMFADSIILVNINMLFDIAFCLQGISVIFMLCHTRRIPRVVPGVLMVLILVFGLCRNIVMLLGFVDLLFGLKYRMKQRI